MNSKPNKPKICIALPGINYLPDTTYVLNTLPIIPYLQEDFEVTLVFREILGTEKPDYKYLTIAESDYGKISKKNQSPYFSPNSLIKSIKDIKTLNEFSRKYAKNFDLLIERQWPLVGALSNSFKEHGIPSVFIIEAEFYKAKNLSLKGLRHPIASLSSSLFNFLLPNLRRYWVKRADSIIVETEQMKSLLLAEKICSSSKPIYPIPNGVDTSIFFPRDRAECRNLLNISQDDFVLTYVGSLNRFIQEPGPIIEALGRKSPLKTSLHIVGDGIKRQELADIAKTFNAPVTFHGKLPQEEAALYIGAANLCIAPYNKNLFPDRQFTSSTLKVCEYLASGRPVMSIPCARMNHLLNQGAYGFLVENDVASYQEFFDNLPSIDETQLKESLIIQDLKNSRLKSQEIVLTWEDIAGMYKEVIRAKLPK